MVYKCQQALRQLRSDESIRILKPDKGSGVVVLDTNDYISKMNVILSDTTKFIQLGPVETHDRTSTIEDDIRKVLDALLDKKQLTVAEHGAVRPMGSRRPRLYGLPKTHKKDVPLRPILSMTGSAQHKLAQWLNGILQPVLENLSKYCVKDSFTFAETMRNEQNTKWTMCSYDVKSLFTNVPLVETINICAEQLYQHDQIGKPAKLEKDSFVELMNLATNGVEFSFNDVMYRQVDGVAMGSPLGPTLANIFVGYLEKHLFSTNTSPNVYLRYVDDTFVMFDRQSDIVDFHKVLNNLHPCLEFTCELEKNNTLPFLDVLVERTNDEFVTSVFRKPTFTGQYVRWNSFCEKRRKRNLVKTLVHRARMICSPPKLPAELEFIKSTLSKNGYPEGFVQRIFKSQLDETKANESRDQQMSENVAVYLRLPYIGSQSTIYGKRIKHAITKCYTHLRPRIIFKSSRILPAAQKDVLPTLTNSNVIYQYTCHCESAYVGRTSQRLQARIKQHIPKYVRNTNASLLNRKPSSSIAKHLVDSPDCRKNYRDSQFKVLSFGRSDCHLAALEALYIMQKKPKLCVQKKFTVYTTQLFRQI